MGVGVGVCVCIGMRDRGGKTSDILFCLPKYLVMSVSLSKCESEETEAQRGKELKVLLMEESCFNLISDSKVELSPHGLCYGLNVCVTLKSYSTLNIHWKE